MSPGCSISIPPVELPPIKTYMDEIQIAGFSAQSPAAWSRNDCDHVFEHVVAHNRRVRAEVVSSDALRRTKLPYLRAAFLLSVHRDCRTMKLVPASGAAGSCDSEMTVLKLHRIHPS